MKQHLKKFRLFVFIIAMIEIALAITFGVLYFVNVFDIQGKISFSTIFIVFASLLFLDIIVLWIGVGVFSKYRRKSDLRAADLIGGDIQEAYNFGMIGLAVVDEDDNVIWVNDLFINRQIDILDTNIIEWQPKLADLSNAAPDASINLEINTRTYAVKYLADAGLYIFKDTTDYEESYAYSKKQATVVGILMIDNYSDISGTADDTNDIISKVRNAIFEYAKEYADGHLES